MNSPHKRGEPDPSDGGALMSTAVHLVGLNSSVPGALDLTSEFDRVL